MRIRIVSLILALAAMLTQAALSTLPASAATTPKPLAARHTLANAELNKVTLDEQSIARPAVDQIGKIVVLAWTGTDPRHSLNIMWDVYGQRQKITMGDNSN